MTKRRMISEDFFQSEKVAEWTMRQRLLVLGIIANADDQGRIRGHPQWLRSRVFPYDNFTADEIEQDIQVISNVNNTVLVYEVEDKRYIQLQNWWEYQSLPWAKKSDFPAPEGWKDRIRMMVYKPKRWVMTLNWEGVEDCNAYKVIALPNELGNKSGDGAGDALRPINTITTTTINTDPIIKKKEGVETAQAYSVMQDHTSQDVAQLYRDVTEQMQPLSANIDEAFRNLELVLDHYDTVEDAVPPGKHIYGLWCQKRGKTGKTYSPLNIAWIEKWLENLVRDQEKAKAAEQRERSHKTAVDASVNKLAKDKRL